METEHEIRSIMNLTLTDEQQELARSSAAFLQKRSPESEVRRLMDSGGAADPVVWAQMADQLGLQGLVIPEEFGGGGFGLSDFALVAEQTGAALLVSPLLSTVMAATALMWSDDNELKSRYLPGLASGELVGTLALAEATGRWDADAVTAVATGGGTDTTVTGTKMYVLDGQFADIFVVSARDGEGVGLFVVDMDAPGVSVTALETLDLTRAQAMVNFTDTPACRLSGTEVFDRTLATAGILLAAEQVGGSQRCLDMAVDYAKIRVQFGRPIGSFQAIKHKCADMLMAVESARSAAYHAAAVLDDTNESPLVAAALAQAYCSATYTKVAGENIQIHGGIGFTWEHPAQLYYKRAKSTELLFGDPSWQRERLAALVGI
ncbi:MAG: acyl-CoA dehydrogenase family protein [Mycobacterium sp.]